MREAVQAWTRTCILQIGC